MAAVTSYENAPYVEVQFHPWLKFDFPLFLGTVKYDNEFKPKENKIRIKKKIEPQHIHTNISS